jgi:hydroxymethylpyrimidine pyrophosphatase-like HAD family hydrolase
LVTGRLLADLQRTFPHIDLFDIVVAENGAVLSQNLNPDVLMMESAEDWCCDGAELPRAPKIRRILVQ